MNRILMARPLGRIGGWNGIRFNLAAGETLPQDRLDNPQLTFGAVWANLFSDGSKRAQDTVVGTPTWLGIGGMDAPARLAAARTRASAALPAYLADVSKYGYTAQGSGFGFSKRWAPTGWDPKHWLLQSVFYPGDIQYNRPVQEYTRYGSDETLDAAIAFVHALGAGASASERSDLDALARAATKIRFDDGVLSGGWLVPPHPYGDPAVARNRIFTRDREPFSRMRQAVRNAAIANRVFEAYHWPGPGRYFANALREFVGHELADLVGSGRALTEDEIQAWVSISLISRFDEIADRVNAFIQSYARKKARLALTRTIALTAIGLAVGGLLSGAALKLAQVGIQMLATTHKKEMIGGLEGIMREFEDEAPAFAGEIDRTKGWITSQLSKEDREAVPPVQEADMPTSTVPAEATTQEIPAVHGGHCTKLGTQETWNDTVMAKKISDAQANKLEIHRLKTGRVTLPGTKSQFGVVDVWACLPGYSPDVTAAGAPSPEVDWKNHAISTVGEFVQTVKDAEARGDVAAIVKANDFGMGEASKEILNDLQSGDPLTPAMIQRLVVFDETMKAYKQEISGGVSPILVGGGIAVGVGLLAWAGYAALR